MIEIKNVYKKYVKDYFTLFDINFNIQTNTLMLGDENSGVDCLFRILAKIEKSFDGEIFVDKENIKEMKDKNLPIAYAPETPYLFNGNLEKNLIFPLKIRKINKNTAKNTVNNATLQYNLKNFPKKIKQMSISQKKIITLIRAIIRKPKYVLIENFFENLDDEFIPLAEQIITDAKKNTIIIASEKNVKNLQCFKDFNLIKFDSGSVKKE